MSYSGGNGSGEAMVVGSGIFLEVSPFFNYQCELPVE